MKEYVAVQGVLVDKRVLTTYFACDYDTCKGACCWGEVQDTLLDGGALTLSEAEEVRKKRFEISDYAEYMFRSSITVKPMYLRRGNHYTNMCQNVCVFSNSEKGTCAMKLAHDAGKLSFGIPVYCELYPLTSFRRNGNIYLEMQDTFDEFCQPAYVKGEKEHTHVYEFCKNALIRFFGENFYTHLTTFEYEEETDKTS